jgi:Flp pilus assembly protein TadB
VDKKKFKRKEGALKSIAAKQKLFDKKICEKVKKRMEIYHRMSSIIPSGLIRAFKKQLTYVGIQVDENRFVGFVMLFGIGIAVAVAINLQLFLNIPWYLTLGAVFAMFAGGIYFWLSQTAESEGSRVERVLPDALELVASNIKAGLPTERSLFISARPEFGVLSDELRNASKKVLAGQRLEESLMDLPVRIKSEVLERTIWLIVQGTKSGGQIADLLLQLGSDLREENAMKDEIRSNISMYIMLIFFAAAFGAPLLFGITSVIVKVMAQQTGSITITPEQMEEFASRSSVGRFFGVPSIAITEDFVVFYSIIVLTVTAFFASFVMGVINHGREAKGVKFIPIILAISLILFFGIRIFLSSALGGLMKGGI